MHTRPWSRHDTFHTQLETISSWCDNALLLESLLEIGHSDAHFAGKDTRISDITKCVDKAFNAGYDFHEIMPTYDITQQEAHRVATEMVHASHFFDKEIMLGALSATILGAAHEINKWLNGDIYCRTTYGLKLHVDIDSFIGTGIAMDGNERATTVATLILTRLPSYVDNIRIPFSIKTMYPDITESHSVGTLVSTGRNFGPEIIRAINASDVATQMYWQLKERGENVHMKNNPRSAVLYATHNGIDYMASYNNNSYNHGFMMVYDQAQNGYVTLNKSTLDRETIRELRNDEARRIGHSLHKATSCDRLSITTTDNLFPEMGGETLRDNGKSLDCKYFDSERE